MKKILLLSVGLIISLIAIIVSVILTTGSSSVVSISDFKVRINGEDPVSLWESEGGDTLYIFLPSHADLSRTTFLIPTGARIMIDDIRITDGDNCSRFSINHEYTIKLGRSDSRKLLFLRSSGIPTLFVNTDSGGMDKVHANKEYKEDANLTLYTSSGQLDYTGNDAIRGHGNSTWDLHKKAYNLHLQDKAALIGMEASKKWVLLANAFDETNLRNKLVLDFARETGSYDGFSPECEFVDVYLNGEYNGLYLLTQSIKDTSSAFLDNSSGNMYELELSTADKTDPSDVFIPLDQTMCVIVKHPSDPSDDEILQLNLLLEDWKSWLRDDQFDTSCLDPDIRSLSEKLLIELLFENYDGNRSSQYYWGNLDERSFHAGPCWDYDLSMGLFFVPWSSPYAFPALDCWNGGKDPSWNSALWDKPDFREYAIRLYRAKYHDKLKDLIDHRIDEEALLISDAMIPERIRWPEYYTTSDSFAHSVLDLKEFMQRRMAFLDSMWIDELPYCRITMKLPLDAVFHLYVPEGSKCVDLPNPSELVTRQGEMRSLFVWFDESTDSPFDPDTLITNDIVLYAGLA